ncbi:MAG: linear amide C-N hydrolase [Candidatus Dadabacteria bacterium]
MKKILISIWFASIFFIDQTPVNACTTFCISDPDHLIFGRNFDFSTGLGHVITNKRNVLKTALVQAPEKSFSWISKYGSVTFNQIGREFPYGGINEKGLVIEQMWLDETVYPEVDKRYGLTELQWIQYQLDNAANVDEVLKSDSLVRVSKLSMATIHFLLCDREGNTAIIEYLNGKMVTHTKTSMPIAVLSNDSYQKCNNYIKNFSGFGGVNSIPNTTESLDRFVKAASMIKNYKNQNVIDYSFEILNNVTQGSGTKWSIVYDIKNMAVYYKTYSNKTVKSFRLSDFDFSCSLPTLFVNMEDNMNNDKLMFQNYSYQSNRNLIDNVFDNVAFLQPLPVAVRELYAKYPETTICNNK